MLEALRRVSAQLGKDPAHVQGPGGNTSLKLDAEIMWIKASGFELKDAETQDVFTRVRFADVVRGVLSDEANPLAGTWDPGTPKPSIETTLHALLPHPVVLHTHSIAAIATACRKDARARLAQLLHDIPHALVPYAKPGIDLARGVRDALAAQPNAQVVILGNHGIVAGGATADAALSLLLLANERLQVPARTAASHSAEPKLAELNRLAQAHGLVVPKDAAIHALALDPTNVSIATRGSLYPDHVVFLGSGAGLLSERAQLQAQGGIAVPKLWLEPGVGALLEPNLPSAAEAMARCLADTVALLPTVESCNYLSVEQEAALLGMEEEKHRQRLARERA